MTQLQPQKKTSKVKVIENDASSDEEWDDVDDINNLMSNTDAEEKESSDESSDNESVDEEDDDYGAEDEEDEGEEEATESDKDDASCKPKSGIANVMQSILGAKKDVNADDVILSRALKDGVKKRKIEKATNNEEGKEEDEEPVKSKKSNSEFQIAKTEWDNMFRKMPDYAADREKERKLKNIATQGVVQLFGAFEKHQRELKKQLSETKSELQREKIMETTDKKSFMNIFLNKKKNIEEVIPKVEVKKEEEKQTIPMGQETRWNVISEQFYQDPKLSSWNRDSEEE